MTRMSVVAVEVAVNFIAPFLLFTRLAPHYGDAHALMAGALPPLLWSLAQFAYRWRIDALSLLILTGIILSLIAILGGGSVRFLQLRENLVTTVIGLAFLGSAALNRPLIYQLALATMRGASTEKRSAFEAKRKEPRFHRIMMLMTMVWGIGLLLSSALACGLVFALSIQEYLIVNPIINYGTLGALALWTVAYRRCAQRQPVKSVP